MTIQILIAIAELCRATGYGEFAQAAADRQRSCQVAYINCFENKYKSQFEKNKFRSEDLLFGQYMAECVKGQ